MIFVQPRSQKQKRAKRCVGMESPLYYLFISLNRNGMNHLYIQIKRHSVSVYLFWYNF